jgi:hypothetical protein
MVWNTQSDVDLDPVTLGEISKAAALLAVDIGQFNELKHLGGRIAFPQGPENHAALSEFQTAARGIVR